MPSRREIYLSIKNRLAQAGYPAAAEANVLFELATGERHTRDADREIDPAQRAALEALAARRIAGEPLQYIAASWPFLDFELAVGPGVLIPRPETETVALRGIELLRGRPQPAALDLCAGSGCLAVALSRAAPDAAVTAAELHEAAFAFLRRNIDALAPAVQAVQADVFGYEKRLADASLDLIIANPPYVTPADYRANLAELRFEPREAFLGGEDGLRFYRHIIKAYRDKLKPGGALLVETGFDQTEAVAALFAQCGYGETEILHDDFGLPRAVFARRREQTEESAPQ